MVYGLLESETLCRRGRERHVTPAFDLFFSFPGRGEEVLDVHRSIRDQTGTGTV